jgi:GNAT superfamily N-acetyltransferase
MHENQGVKAVCLVICVRAARYKRSNEQYFLTKEKILNLRIKPVAFDDIRSQVKQHLNALPSAIDSFLEDHILESAHYQIFIEDKQAGFTSIHKGSLITQFSLFPEFRKYGQDIFVKAKKLEEVQAAFVPTCDEFFLSHALDNYRQINKQAYFFAAPANLPEHSSSYVLRQAVENDIGLVKKGAGDFFGDAQTYIAKQELFLVLLEHDVIGFGLATKSVLLEAVASIGMFVIEGFRKQGMGTATLQLLVNECKRQKLQPVAGCWYYNHLSKKTLEKAGLFSQTRLLKIEF